MPLGHLNFITGNTNKLVEVKAILGDIVPLQSQSLDLTEIQGTIQDISKDKCQRAAAIIGGPVLTEDTCLCFNALKELPGPYIKWFLQALGHEGLNNLLMAYKDKSAQAVCTFAYCSGPGHEPIIFEGRVTGTIVAARGPTNFGWDPIFEYDGETYAEMDKAKKNMVSHRAIALSKLKRWLQAQ
ncbi:hypothetical protein HO133_000313 [Letharia lupina]|uniref:Inosine triphosphate pyrophosphatase n=2 Tax=Letharia TaxID=112415 RepID=A0A8H6CH45_9LECA|nr:uncharacterized protein HO133_000313 [Letharia lupina]XP_037170832.1 uncharacterized protein HO173_000303 [Letharia columbiana]KAF6223470.1 hypothetical protein HO133_000313 [Letharia lupina]KAF6241592.1 hypothetical protein HO173_000303 [Letharia columbiana]